MEMFCGWAYRGLEFPTLLHRSYKLAFPYPSTERKYPAATGERWANMGSWMDLVAGGRTPYPRGDTAGLQGGLYSFLLWGAWLGWEEQPALQRKGRAGDGDEVQGDREVNANAQWRRARKAQLQHGEPLVVTAAEEVGAAWILIAWFSPHSIKEMRYKFIYNFWTEPALWNMACCLSACQKMLPALSSRAPWDKALPTPALPLPGIWPPSLPSASSTGGYFFGQVHLINTAGLSKTFNHPPRDLWQRIWWMGFTNSTSKVLARK